MKYEITDEQLKELLEMHKECSDFVGELEDLGISLEGVGLKISGDCSLIDLIFDILGLPQAGFTKFKNENPRLNNTELCKQFQKKQDSEPYSFCRDTLISNCFRHLEGDETGINKCLKYMVKSVQEWKEASKCP